MNKLRLYQAMLAQHLTVSRHQAESLIKLRQVSVNGKIVTKIDSLVDENDQIRLKTNKQYVSRAALKLASIVPKLKIDFRDKRVLDVGSSTGGFTDYALQHGALSVVAVDAGTRQLHPSLINHPKIELHEKTDIRDFKTKRQFDIVLIDVSFISVREVLPHIASLAIPRTAILAMVKPQFETASTDRKHKGIIKNNRIRRDILKAFEEWSKSSFVISNKADSDITGAKGNRERFYLLKIVPKTNHYTTVDKGK